MCPGGEALRDSQLRILFQPGDYLIDTHRLHAKTHLPLPAALPGWKAGLFRRNSDRLITRSEELASGHSMLLGLAT